MAPALLPVTGEPPQRQAEDLGSEVGVAFAFDEQQEAAVVANQSEAASLLARTPANPLLATFELGGAAPLKVSRATPSPSTSAT